MRSVPSRLSGMTLFTVSNTTWLNVEGTLNSWNRAKCSIASAGAVARGSTPRPQRGSFSEPEIDHFVMAITSAEATVGHTTPIR